MDNNLRSFQKVFKNLVAMVSLAGLTITYLLGCSSMWAHGMVQPGKCPVAFGGVRGLHEFPFWGRIVDAPFTLVGDTLMLPFDLACSEDVSESVDSHLREAGFNDAGEVRSFLYWMKSVTGRGEKAKVLELIRLPLQVSPNKSYAALASVENDFDQIFSPKVLSAIEKARYKDLLLNTQGAVIGTGEVFFNKVDRRIKIWRIDP